MNPKTLHKNKSGLRVRPEPDEPLVEAALKLTSPQVSTEAAAAEVFADIAKAATPPFTTGDWDQAQSLLQQWLPKISTLSALPPSTRARLYADINLRLAGGIFAPPRVRLGARGLVLVADDTESIASACLRAVLLFFTADGISPRRLAVCQLESCGQWFLRPRAKRGSVPLYCSPKHANVAHQRAYRQRRGARQ